MLLSVGDQLGSYEVLALVGKGSRGEVYRARDSRLKRDVAIKVSTTPYSERYIQEARSLAALSHANVCRLYDVGPDYLVMEFIEGQDLSGPLPWEKALPVIQQFIDGMEAAHDKNILHGGLAPSKIKITPEGVVKILDFGLAKTYDGAPGNEGDPENRPASATGNGRSAAVAERVSERIAVPQSVAYRAPEQIKGWAADKRTDIWSFGIILYELLTEKQVFRGDSPEEIMEAVVSRPPDISAAPPRVRRLLRWCLEKDRKLRLASISDARGLLAEDLAPAPIVVAASPAGKPKLVWGISALAAVAVLMFLWGRPTPTVASTTRLAIPMPAGQEIADYPAISADGQTLAYVTQRGAENPQLYLRDLGSFDARPVPGSGGAQKPFFSPDGKWVAFFAQGQLQKADVSGGAPLPIADATSPYGGTWNEDNTIIYVPSLGAGLLRVPANGGTPETLARPDVSGNGKGSAYFFPQALPGGHSILFTIWGQTPGSAVLSLDSRKWELSLPAQTGAALFDHAAGQPTGHLLIADDAASIKSAPFDASHPGHTAAEASVLSNVYSTETDQRAWLAVSNTGTAVYASGNPAKRSLAWVDQEGQVEPLPIAQDLFGELALSPDGTKAVVRQGFDLWIHDLLRRTRNRLTSGDQINMQPVWSTDGTRIFFASNRAGDWDIYSQVADASAPAQVLLKLPADQFPLSVLPDGTLLYSEIHPKTGSDLWTLSPDGTTTPVRVTPNNETDGQFSPGPEGASHWLAYSSDESGRPEIYVQSYPSGANRIQVSNGGGIMPHWSSDGKELYYVTNDSFMAVSVKSDGSLGPQRKLFDRSNFLIRFRGYDVSAGGRFMMIQRDPASIPRQLNVILNWSEESEAAAPVKP